MFPIAEPPEPGPCHWCEQPSAILLWEPGPEIREERELEASYLAFCDMDCFISWL
jgi:hypothetical protein